MRHEHMNEECAQLLMSGIQRWRLTGDDSVLRDMMMLLRCPTDVGGLLIVPLADAHRFGRSTPFFVRFDSEVGQVVCAPDETTWRRERPEMLRKLKFGQRASGSGGTQSSTTGANAHWRADPEMLRRWFADAPFGDFRGDSYASDAFLHAEAFREAEKRGRAAAGAPPRRVDLSGGDCIEVPARVVDFNPDAPLARPERTMP